MRLPCFRRADALFGRWGGALSLACPHSQVVAFRGHSVWILQGFSYPPSPETWIDRLETRIALILSTSSNNVLFLAATQTKDHANRPDHSRPATAATGSEASAPSPQSIPSNVNDSPSLQRPNTPSATASAPPAANGSSNTCSDSNACGLDRTAIDVLSARIQSHFNADVYGPRTHSGGGRDLPASISLPSLMLSPVPSTAEGAASQSSESGTRSSASSVQGNASAASSEPRSEAAGRRKGRGRRRTRRDSAGKRTSAAEGGVSAPKDSSSVAKDSELPGRATGMMASLMMGGDPLVKKAAAAAGFAPASASIPSGFGPFGVGEPPFLGPGAAAAAAAAMAAAASAAARHHHHRTHPSPLLCQPWGPQPWHGGNPQQQQQQQQQEQEQEQHQQQDGETMLPSSPPTEEQATAASRAAATAMAAAKVQLLGLPWRAFGGHLVGPEGDPSSGKLRRPSDQRATAAAAALAGLGAGQWGRGEFAKHPTLAQDLYSYPYPGAKFCPPGVISPRGGMATNSPASPPLDSSTKLSGAKLAAAAVNASATKAKSTKAIGNAGGEGAGSACAATSAAEADSGFNDSELAGHVDVGGGSGDIPNPSSGGLTSPAETKGVAESRTLSVASESAAANAGAPAPSPPREKPRYEAPVRQWQVL